MGIVGVTEELSDEVTRVMRVIGECEGDEKSSEGCVTK
jgi:hypothetical protein